MTGPNEWQVRANYYVGLRALGGRLASDGVHLTFKPHFFERALGGRATFDAGFDRIQAVSVNRNGAVPRKRLTIVLTDGSEAVFLVPRVDDYAERIRNATHLRP